MTCPRCGLKIGISSLSRCPQCGQPLQAPISQSPRITKVLSETEVTGQQGDPAGSAAWPDLYEAAPVELALGHEPSFSVFRPLEGRVQPWARFPNAPSSLLRGTASRRNLILAVLATIAIVALVLGGGLYLASTHGRSSASTGKSPNSQNGSIGLATTTPTTTSTATAISSPTSSPTSVPPSGVTSAPPPAPTATPAPQLVTIFFDPLTSNTKGWPTQNGCAFVSSGYQVTHGSQCIAPVTAADTVNISVQMETTDWSVGGAGIGFRIPSGQTTQQYLFYVYPSGFCVAQDASNHTVFFATMSSAVHQGANATNILAIDQSGAHMTFYVNSTVVGGATDATLGGGEVALEADNESKTVTFTNFTLTTLN